MDLTLVPFGYLTSQQQLVDVQNVPSGKKCGCICPSCRAPLVARKGNKNVWHFAHDSKGEVQNKLEKCSFSFYVSARMMARQLIGNRLSIHLPRLEVTVSETNPLYGVDIKITKVVTEARTITLDAVSLDTTVGEARVDLCGRIEGYRLAFVFTHPGRDDFSHLAHLIEDKTGIVEISLTGLRAQFHATGESHKTYSDILAEFITTDTLSKKWLYHPGLLHTERQATLEMEARQVAMKAIIKQATSRQTELRFDCRLCKSSWTGETADNASCKNCGASPLLVARTEIQDHKN